MSASQDKMLLNLTKIISYFKKAFKFLDWAVYSSAKLFHQIKQDLRGVLDESISFGTVNMDYLQSKNSELLSIVTAYQENLELSEQNRSMLIDEKAPEENPLYESENNSSKNSCQANRVEQEEKAITMSFSEPIYLLEHKYLEALEKKVEEVKNLKGALYEAVEVVNTLSVILRILTNN